MIGQSSAGALAALVIVASIADPASSAEPKFDPNRPAVSIGSFGGPDQDRYETLAAIVHVLQLDGLPTTPIGPERHVWTGPITGHPESEERARGITISTAHVEYETENRHYDQINPDVGDDFPKQVIAGGAAQTDGAILVVSATDGPMPQTREHILLARQVGVPALVVFLNNVFEAGPDRTGEVEAEIRDTLDAVGYGGTPIIQGDADAALEGDAVAQERVRQLLAALDDHIPQRERDTDKPFLMAIEDVFSVSGRGTVVMGRIERGVITVGDEVEIVGIKDTSKEVVTGVEMFRKLLDRGEAGDNAGILLRGVKRDDVERGQVLAKPGSITPHRHFEAEVYVLTKEEGGHVGPFFAKYRPQFYFRTTDVTGRLVFPASLEFAQPGENVMMAIELDEAVAVSPSMRFAVRLGDRTVAAGVVTEILD
jgi:elongation factor Tu